MSDKIKMSLSQIQTAEGKLKQEIEKQDQRVKSATAEVEMVKVSAEETGVAGCKVGGL